MPPRKRARAAASSATIACDRSAIVLKQSAAIGAIYEAGELCDGEVKLGQQNYPVSRMVLASASPFFKAAFSGTMREGVQQAVALDASLSATAVEALLKFVALLPITVPEDEVEDLIAAADMLNIVDAVPLIASQLVTSVTRENCLVRLGLAGRYDLDALAKAALQTIDKHFADVGGVRRLPPAARGGADAPARVRRDAIYEGNGALREQAWRGSRTTPPAPPTSTRCSSSCGFRTSAWRTSYRT